MTDRDDAPPTALSIVLETSQHTMPACQVFRGVAYLRRLAGHRRRIQRELARLDDATTTARAGPRPKPKPQLRPALLPPPAGEPMTPAKMRRTLLIECGYAIRSRLTGWKVVAACYAEIITPERAAAILECTPGELAKLLALADAEMRSLAPPATEGAA